MINKADDLYDNDDFEGAISKYEEIIEIDPSYEDAYKGIIKSCIEIQDAEKMREYLSLAKTNLDNHDYQRLNDKVKEYNLDIINFIHTCALTAMMDPEVVNDSTYNESFKRFERGYVLANMQASFGAMESEILEIMGADNGKDIVEKLCILGEDDPQVKIRMESRYFVEVYVVGHGDLTISNDKWR